MKKTSIIMAPLFAAVVVLLSIGTLGELIVGLFTKIKNLLPKSSTAIESSSEQAVQIK